MGVYDNPVSWSEGTGGNPPTPDQLTALAQAVAAVNPGYSAPTFSDPAGATALRADDLNGLSAGLKAASDALVSLQAGGLPGGALIDNGEGGATVGAGGGTSGGSGVALPLVGAGIDLTGVSDSTAGVQAFLDACADGDTVVVPTHATIRLGGTLTVSKRTRLTGSGELRWTAGIAAAPMLDVTADGCQFDGVYLTNPNHLAVQTGGSRTYGIRFRADRGSVIGSLIVGQQQAICVDVAPAGDEFHDFVFIGNRILDVPGSGDGPSDTSSANGEDRGDGIVVWGAAATIVGNRVAALDGTDARIGIHVENLGGSGYVHASSMCTIVGNVVTGQFRRGITSEGVSHVAITGNSIADSTEWGINLANTAARAVVFGNTIAWTRTSADNQGKAWSPDRSGIMLYSNVTDAILANNVIYTVAGSLMPFGISIFQQNVGSTSYVPSRILVQGNLIDATASGGMQRGISMPTGASEITIRGNKLIGFTQNGVLATGVNDLRVIGNEMYGIGTPFGVNATGAANSAVVDGNVIQQVSTAIQVRNRTAYQSASNNRIYSAAVGIDLQGCSGPALAGMNLFAAVTTPTQNLPAGTGTTGNVTG